ncbi:ribonuclease H-like domain-containing protein [Tanacetum coccineum]
MQHCNPCRTPVDTESKLGSDGDPVSDPTLYRSLAGALQYLTFTCPDISYVVQQVCLYIHDPHTYFNYAHLTAYTDADMGLDARYSSSAEAEYRGVANVVAETAWIRNLLLELHAPLTTATLVYCDNVSAVYLTTNPVQHQRTKHYEIDIHICPETNLPPVSVRVLHIPSRFSSMQYLPHKGIPSACVLVIFRSSLNVPDLPFLLRGSISCH